jgi:hypothetical protein
MMEIIMANIMNRIVRVNMFLRTEGIYPNVPIPPFAVGEKTDWDESNTKWDDNTTQWYEPGEG